MTYDEANKAAVEAFTARIHARTAIERAAADGFDREDMYRLWCEYDLAVAREGMLNAQATLLFPTRGQAV